MPRNLEFDPNDVITAAMQLYWHKGYESTSMQDVVKVTGVNPGSLYAVFKNKRNLLISALKEYQSCREATIRKILQDAESPLQGIICLVRGLTEQLKSTSDGPRYCLALRMMSTIGESDLEVRQICHAVTTTTQNELEVCFQKAIKEGELTELADAESLALYITTNIYGLRMRGLLNDDDKLIELAGQMVINGLQPYTNKNVLLTLNPSLH